MKSILKSLKFKLVYKKPIFGIKPDDKKYLGNLKFRTTKTKEDIDLCLKIYKAALKNTDLVADYSDSLNPKFIFNEYIINKNKTMNLIATHNDKDVGFFTLHINKKKDFGYIGFISILKKYRGQGFSKEMLNKIYEIFYKKKINRWLESTDSKNIPMINSFKKYGFKKIRDFQGYIYQPEIGYDKFLKYLTEK